MLTNPEDTSVQLLVDTETYLPVVFRGRALDEDLDTDVELRMEWNAEVAISAPADTRQVSPDEFALALASFFFGTLGVAEGPSLPPGTGGQPGAVTEGGRTSERAALWLELGASSYGDALDDAGDLFHGDPGITPVRSDPTIDIRRWGVGVVELADPTSRELFGPDGAFPCGSPDPVVACGADGLGAGSYLLVWIALLESVPLDDAEFVRSYWTVFQDGDPANDFVALPQFANDVLDGSDTHYRLEATPDGWQLARTFGPQLEPMRTTGAAMILEDIIVFLVPASGTRQSRCPEPGRGQLQRSGGQSVRRGRRLGPLAGRAAAADAARRGGVLRRPLGVSPDRRRRALWRGGTRTSRANRPSGRASGGVVCRRGE